MNFEEAVSKFVESPCRLTTGVPSLSKRWNIDLDTLYAAKASAKDILKNKEKFGTGYNPKDVSFNEREINLTGYKDSETCTIRDAGNNQLEINIKESGKLKSNGLRS